MELHITTTAGQYPTQLQNHSQEQLLLSTAAHIYCIRFYPLAPAGALPKLPLSTTLIMHFPNLPTSLLVTLALHYGVNAAASDEKVLEPCTVSSATGNFYDLRSLSIALPADDKKPVKGEKIDDWHARGYDYHKNTANFTLNICAPVVGKVEDIEGVDKSLWRNVSAYYELGSKKYSIG